VRDYVAEKVGHRYLVPIVAEPLNFTESIFDALPMAFVMKAIHGSGLIQVVRNKRDTSFEELNALAQRWLATDFYTIARERHYHTIERSHILRDASRGR
jgi:TupA-like ATPgrasp